jgi:hypothetical protein
MIHKKETELTKFANSFVGIFWAVQERRSAVIILDHRCPTSEAERYGDMLTCPHGHYEMWEGWRRDASNLLPAIASIIRTCEYEEWPRGRVVCTADTYRFILYADTQILRRSALVAEIRKTFGLPESRTEIEGKEDSHYRSTRRLTNIR